MAEWLNDLRGGLLFDTAAFIRFRDRSDTMWRGVLLIVIVALLAGLPAFLLDLGRAAGGRSPAQADSAQAQAEFERLLQPFVQNMPPQVLQQVQQSTELSFEIASRIQALPTALPGPLAAALHALGNWFTRPFARTFTPLGAASLATWLGYGIWVMLSAKALGGRAELRSFFGATSLFAAPHLLNVFGFIPVLGALLGVIAFFWGLAIYVKGTAVSQEMTVGRAVLAVLLPVIVLVVLVGLALVLLASVLLISGSR